MHFFSCISPWEVFFSQVLIVGNQVGKMFASSLGWSRVYNLSKCLIQEPGLFPFRNFYFFNAKVISFVVLPKGVFFILGPGYLAFGIYNASGGGRGYVLIFFYIRMGPHIFNFLL